MAFSDESNRRGRFFRYAPLVLWVGVIFILSSAQGAATNTSRFIGPLLEWLFPAASEDLLAAYHAFIRKFAHFAEYAVLGFFASRAFRGSSTDHLRRHWYAWAALFVALIASLDEYNQSLNSLRTGSIYDALLDCAGGLTAVVICCLYRIRTNSGRDSTAEY